MITTERRAALWRGPSQGGESEARVRSKLLLTTICLAGSLWAGGCQHRPQCTNGQSKPNSESGPRPAAKGAEVASLRIGGTRPADGAEPKKSPSMSPVFIVPPQAKAAPPTPRDMPLVATTAQAPASRPARVQPAKLPAPSSAAREAPLPPLAVPNIVPAPATKAVAPPLVEEHIVVADRAGAVPPAQPLHSSSFVEFGPKADRAANAGSRSLTGEVQQFRRSWRLRYAGVDVADPHGGSVILDGPGLDRLKEGSRIRVTGTLIPAAAEERLGSARFQVQSLEVLDN